MSIQLSLYPQQNEGIYTWTSSYVSSNLLADPNFSFAYFYFNNIIVSTNSIVPHYHALILYQPTGVWAGFHTSAGSYNAVSAPSVSSNILYLRSAAGSTVTGVHQKCFGIIPGITYFYEISIKQSARGTLTVGIPGQAQTFTAGGNTLHQTGVFHHTFTTNTQQYFSVTGSFTATGNHCVMMCSFQGDGTNSDSLQIMSISIKQDPNSPNITDVNDGQVVVDLYEHTPIPMTLSVDDFKNMAEKPQSYSKAFNLPATKHNNKIFTNIFDVSTSVHMNANTFNPYLITKAILKEDGVTIFEGHLRLVDIKQKEEETAYTVNLFSTSVSLKAILGNKTFNDFDGGVLGGGTGLNELVHIHTKASIKPSWIGRLPLLDTIPAGYTGYLTDENGDRCTGGETMTNVLKYPFIQWNGGITQEQGGSQNGWPELNHMSNAFRPWIKLKYLVDRIIGEAGFTYQSDFMEGIGNYLNPNGDPANVRKYPDFERLFMDFNWGPNVTPGNFGTTIEATYKKDDDTTNNHLHPCNTYKNIRFNSGEAGLEQFGWNPTTHEFTVPEDNWNYTISYSVSFYNSNASGDKFHMKLTRYNSSGASQGNIDTHWNNTPSSSTVTTISGGGSTIGMQGDVIKLQAQKVNPCPGAQSDIIQGDPMNTDQVTATITVSVDPINMQSDTLLLKRGKMKQWDFLKELITMFNLIILQDKSDASKLKIDTYDDIFIDNEHTTGIDAVTHDWTDKVDVTQHELKPLKLKKDVHWKYKEDKKDYATGVYLDATSDPFGNFAITTNATVPSGEQKIELKQFASTFTKPLFAGFTQMFTVPQIVNQKSDGTIVGFDNKPRILYDVWGDGSNYNHLPQLPNTNSVQKTYRIPGFHGVTGEQQTRFCQFSHVTNIPTPNASRDFNFGSMQLISGGSTPRTIFNEYWAPYYDELYHSDTMTVKIRVLLSPDEISNFNFYDKIFIKNREYRCNKIDYKAGELSTIELILLP